jgi:hypothetical protein
MKRIRKNNWTDASGGRTLRRVRQRVAPTATVLPIVRKERSRMTPSTTTAETQQPSVLPGGSALALPECNCPHDCERDHANE